MATSADECVSPPSSFQSDAYKTRVTGVLPGSAATAPRILLFWQALERILKVHCFPEYWFFRSPAERSALIKARSESWAPCLSLSAAAVSRPPASCSPCGLHQPLNSPAIANSSLAARSPTVTAVTLTAERDLKTLHSRPALLQEVTWQPRYMTGPPVADRNSIGEIVFSFVDDRLFKMTVVYERGRTTGLTNADMIAALTELYGAPTGPAAPPRAAADALDTAAVIAEWRQEDTHIELRRGRYNESFSLVITSVSLDAIARKAQASALVMDVREAPAREAALAKSERTSSGRRRSRLERPTRRCSSHELRLPHPRALSHHCAGTGQRRGRRGREVFRRAIHLHHQAVHYSITPTSRPPSASSITRATSQRHG